MYKVKETSKIRIIEYSNNNFLKSATYIKIKGNKSRYPDLKKYQSFFLRQCYLIRKLLLLSHISRVRLCAIPQTEAHQAPLSLGFSRQKHWSGFPFPSPVHAMQETQETRVQSLGWEYPLEKEMATRSSTLARRIPWTEKPDKLQSMGS